MKLYSVLFILFFSSIASFAQDGYWQQRTDYKIDINLNVEDHTFTGNEVIRYTNNSPHKINKIYYHLFFNAFQPGSMMDNRNLSLPDADKRVGDRISKLNSKEEGHIHVTKLSMNEISVDFEEHGTILIGRLKTPIAPGETVQLSMNFEGQVPLQIRRSGRNNKEGISYSMSQWYPKLCAYDKDGWHPIPYVGREFYGNWGDFNVSITLNADYKIGASGVLQNKEEIGYGYADKSKNKRRNKRGQLTWKFRAENVHDFVWAADADYKHVVHPKSEEAPEMHFLYQENEKTEAWEKLPKIMEEAFAFINKKCGHYPYPVYSFIQGGDGGMEYPMATLITGERPLRSLVGVSVHELLHSWYQMILGTNESLYPWMDEGFTSYFSTACMQHLVNKGLLPGEKKEGELYAGTIGGFAKFTASGYEEPLSTMADHYTTNTAYGVGSYTKGTVFLVQLRYIIGEKDFDQTMLKYFKMWKFKHPTPHDFIRIAEKESDMELDWFLSYFVDTKHTVNYSIDSVYQVKNKTMVNLSRKGVFPMPIDIDVTLKDGKSKHLTIPLRIMYGAKEKDGSTEYMVQPDWPWTNPTYTLELDCKSKKIKEIAIDQTGRLVDTDRMDNYWPEREQDNSK